jgi:phosphate transport system substrate-binding protein
MKKKGLKATWGIFPLLAAFLLLMAAPLWAAEMNLTGAGATFPYPIYSKWFDVYAKQNGVHINYQSIGSGGGIQQLKAGTVDFGASDAPLTNADQATMPGAVVHIPTVAGSVAVVYNLPGVDKGLQLTPQVLANIYLGNTKNWNDAAIAALNPKVKLPNLPIVVAHRSDGSGTSFIFTSYLSTVSRPWATRVGAGKAVNWPVGIGGKGNEGVAGLVKQTPGGIGYVELAYSVQNNLDYAKLQNRAGKFIAPSLASTTAAAAGAIKAMQKDVRVSIVNAPGEEAYPIAGFTYLLVYRNQGGEKGKALVEFLRWAITDGQKYASPLLYAPLPEAVVKINQATIKTLKIK